MLSASVTDLSFRNGDQLDSPVLDGIHSGNNVYLRADATEMEGQTIDVQVWEDDGIGDDLITTVPITIGAQGFGTATWQAAWQAADEDAPFNRYYLFYDVPLEFGQRLFRRCEYRALPGVCGPSATRSKAVRSARLTNSLRQRHQCTLLASMS